jgi:hypothetical protein
MEALGLRIRNHSSHSRLLCSGEAHMFASSPYVIDVTETTVYHKNNHFPRAPSRFSIRECTSLRLSYLTSSQPANNSITLETPLQDETMDYCLTGAEGCTLMHPVRVAEIRHSSLPDTLDMYYRTQACYDARCYGVFEEWKMEETLDRVERMLGYPPNGNDGWYLQHQYGEMQSQTPGQRYAEREPPRQRYAEREPPRQQYAERQRPSQRHSRGQRQRSVVVEIEEPDDESRRPRPAAEDDIEVEEVVD